MSLTVVSCNKKSNVNLCLPKVEYDTTERYEYKCGDGKIFALPENTLINLNRVEAIFPLLNTIKINNPSWVVKLEQSCVAIFDKLAEYKEGDTIVKIPIGKEPLQLFEFNDLDRSDAPINRPHKIEIIPLGNHLIYSGDTLIGKFKILETENNFPKWFIKAFNSKCNEFVTFTKDTLVEVTGLCHTNNGDGSLEWRYLIINCDDLESRYFPPKIKDGKIIY